MTTIFNKANELDIESPCHENWDTMQGQGAQRFCEQCDKHVHHLDAMPLSQRTSLLSRADAGESICVRFNPTTLGLQTLLERIFSLRLNAPILAAVTLALLILPLAEAAPTTDAPCTVKPKNTRPIKMGKIKPPEKPKEPQQTQKTQATEEEQAKERPQILMGLMKMPDKPAPEKPTPENPTK